ncbi:putative cardiolipin synthase [Halomonas ventosae]|uniref:Putative cardiolipin synthase n=2 Tax=Halomonas ventosae TaxID=229007 RepID=A0A4R6ZI12_9GAMM|nr:putative cardiolipin synthase [Halomonas ventosae]
MTAMRTDRAAGYLWRGGLLALLLLLSGCAASPVAREHTTALTPEAVASTSLGRWALDQAAPHEGLNGLALLADGRDAFAVRSLLAARAERRLDIQTYLMGDGITTRALLHRVLEAAERGVTVRLLLDDIGAVGQDARLAALDSHPRIEVRVYNALPLGRGHLATRVLASLPVAGRQHRRMHNKLWLADNALGIVGGRNLGDEYYNANSPRNFADLDLLVMGPVMEPLSRSFDLYWNHGLAQPIGRYRQAAPDAWQGLRDDLAAWLEARSDSSYFNALRERYESRSRSRLADALHWGEAEALWDPPGKPARRGRPPLAETMAGQLARRVAPESRLLLVSAYFVPTEAGSRRLQALAEAGIEVKVVTNSLEASDVPVVHGAYAPYRAQLLASGVALFELRGDLEADTDPRDESVGSSASVLHIKALGIDQDRLFVGSANADPRSVWWNTEVGVLAESEPLFDDFMDFVAEGASPQQSYALELDARGRLHWLSLIDGRPVHLDREPGSAGARFLAWLSGVLGLEPWL